MVLLKMIGVGLLVAMVRAASQPATVGSPSLQPKAAPACNRR